MKNARGSIIILVTVFIAALLLGGVGYGYLTDWSWGGLVQRELVPSDPYEDWLTYTNEEYGFSIKYPVNWYARGESSASSYSLSFSFSYRPEPEPFSHRFNDNIAIKIYDGFKENSFGSIYWSSPEAYYRTLVEIPIDESRDLPGSLLTYSVTARKFENLREGGVKVYLLPGPDTATEPFADTNYYYFKSDILYEISISIPQDNPHYKTAVAIAESFRMANP